MKKILMLTTGGDIAGEHTDTGLVPVYTGEQLVSMVPELREYCELECKDIMQLDGTNVQPEDWVTIAEEVYDAQEAYDGVIITHGTDTMAYSACAVSLMVQNLQKPVIFTGAQIAMVDPDTDGKKNLLDAVHAAVSGIPGVYVVFGGRIIRGIRAQKMYTRALDAFHSINAGDAGYVQDGEVFLNQSVPTPVGEPVLDTRLEPKVVQLKLLPGIEPKQLESMLGMGYYGIILEAFGCGGIPNQNRNLLPCLKRAKQFGVAVLVATQCKYGNVDLGVYDVNVQAAREGAMSVYDMSIEADGNLLCWRVYGKETRIIEIRKARIGTSDSGFLFCRIVSACMILPRNQNKTPVAAAANFVNPGNFKAGFRLEQRAVRLHRINGLIDNPVVDADAEML